MDRLLHHELRCSSAALLALVGSASVVFPVRGLPSLPSGGPATLYVVGALALWGLIIPLRATRIKGIGELRAFDDAAHMGPESVPPARDFWRDRPVLLSFLPVPLVPALAGGFFWDPWCVLFPLALLMDWGPKSALIARWERGNGRLLWRGRVDGRPWELCSSPVPVSPPAPVRTATGEPPV